MQKVLAEDRWIMYKFIKNIYLKKFVEYFYEYVLKIVWILLIEKVFQNEEWKNCCFWAVSPQKNVICLKILANVKK